MIKGIFAIDTHLFLVTLLTLLNPIAAKVPITSETIVEITATNKEVIIDFIKGEFLKNDSYQEKLTWVHLIVVSPLLNEKTTIAKMGA
ncbi:hypothetical protein mmcaprivi_07030 [Mycoplasma mycoides]|nr:hypothetical protein mmcaprivi_07030 [Mycoplasma mycoides]